jgi:hypothetical protein
LRNPFAKNALDLKAQTLLTQRDPELAAHYKAMAADPYGTLAKYHDAEAARVIMEQIPYGETEHSVNPFRTDDQTAQARFIKNAPPGVVEFCRNEAKPVEIPLFGKNKNLTVEAYMRSKQTNFGQCSGNRTTLTSAIDIASQ